MKLHELLTSYKGKELTSEMISAISSQVDVIKVSAVEKATAQFKDYEQNKKELESFREEKTKAEFNENWKKAGGIENPKLDDYKLDNYKKEDGSLDHKKLFKAHPSLQNNAKETNAENKPQANSSSSVFSAITGISGNDVKQAGDGGSENIKVY